MQLQDRYANILDPDTYANGVPHATFQRLRDEEPVSWWEEEDGSGFWAITRYADLLEVSRQPKIFTCTKGIRLEEMAEDEFAGRTTLMEMDPPEHTTLRRLVNPPFLPRAVETYAEELRQLAREVIADARNKSEFDFVTEIARPLPMRMLGKIMNIPDEDGR